MANLLNPICRHADADDDRIALRTGGAPWTYRQLRDASLRYAGALRENGLSTGDRILLAAPSVPEFVVAYMGIQALGGVVVPINTMSTRAEVEYFLADSGATLAIGWHGLGPAVAEAAAAGGVPTWSLAEGARVDADALAEVADRALELDPARRPGHPGAGRVRRCRGLRPHPQHALRRREHRQARAARQRGLTPRTRRAPASAGGPSLVSVRLRARPGTRSAARPPAAAPSP